MKASERYRTGMQVFVPLKGRDPCQMALDLGETSDDVILSMQQTSLSRCKVRYPKLTCRCGTHVRRSGCMHRDCPECAEFVKYRRGNHIFDRFKLVRGDRAVCRTTFTVPLAHRRRYLARHEWRKAVKAMVNILKRQYGFEFGVEVSHPISESNPDVFHPHMNLLWLRRPGFAPFIPKDQLAQLHTKWAEILGGCKVVNIKHNFYSSDGKIKHACRYNARNFPGLSIWQGPVRWYGKIPKMAPHIHECPHCHECFVFVGFALESEYYEELELTLNTS